MLEPFWDERMRSMMQRNYVVAALSAMLLVCAICCVPVVSLELFVSDGGVDEVGSTHVQTIPFALNQDGTEVDMTLGPQEYPLTGINVVREIVRFRGFSRSGTALVSSGTNRVLELSSTDVLFADLTVRGGDVHILNGGCVLVSTFSEFGNVMLSNVLFVDCSCQLSGGAIAVVVTNALYVVNSEFANNEAILGGAVLSQGGLEIRNSTFRGNRANSGAGAVVEGGDLDTVVDGCYFTNNSDTSSGGSTIDDRGNEHCLLVTNTIFGNNTAGSAIASRNLLEVDTVEIREVGEYFRQIVSSPLNITMQRTLLGSVASISAAIRSSCVFVDDVVLDAGATTFVSAEPALMAPSIVTIGPIARNDGDCATLFNIDDLGLFLSSTLGGEVNSTNLCGTCATDVNVVGTGPRNDGGSFTGELIFDGMTVSGGALRNLMYSSTACTSTAVCGSGVFGAVGGRVPACDAGGELD